MKQLRASKQQLLETAAAHTFIPNTSPKHETATSTLKHELLYRKGEGKKGKGKEGTGWDGKGTGAPTTLLHNAPAPTFARTGAPTFKFVLAPLTPRKMGTPGSRAVIGVSCIQAPWVLCWCEYGMRLPRPAADLVPGILPPEKLLKLDMQNHAIWCIFGRKMVRSTVHIIHY